MGPVNQIVWANVSIHHKYFENQEG